MHVIGTAGHVDHGKSSLVRALTGIDPDRLKEEKARQMTIDLGFAWLDLPGFADPVGIIDVPGHRDFIENMLAGVGGIDALLLVIAADEGIMPQTREHLAIIDLLQIRTGIVVLTKTDLVQDQEWLQLVELEITELLSQTALAHAPIMSVSARTGEGIESLRERIGLMLQGLPPPPDLNRPRLWVDRVFTIAGFGTVVTGTLLDGVLRVGQEVSIQPKGIKARVRGLQSHHQEREIIQPGSRAAVNLAGIDRESIQRGQLLTLPGQSSSSYFAFGRFRHLMEASRPLRYNAEVKLFVGTAETVARVRLLEGESLAPGTETWIRLDLRDALPLSRGDRFILRYPSPGETIGGGEIIDPAAGFRFRRSQPDLIPRLEALADADPVKLVTQIAVEPLTVRQISEKTQLPLDTVSEAIQIASGRGMITQLDTRFWVEKQTFQSLLERLTRSLTEFHQNEPLRPGMRPEKLRAALKLEPAPCEALLETALQQGLIKRALSGIVLLPNFAVRWSKTQKANIDKLMRAFEAAPYTPPSVKEASEMVGPDVLTSLVELGELRQVSPEVLFTPVVFERLVLAIRDALEATGHTSVALLRDQFSTTRKYALGLLEYLNAQGITKRDGDNHILASGDWAKILP